MNLYYFFNAFLLTSCKAETQVQNYFRYTGPGVISGTLIQALTAQSGLKCASTCSSLDNTCDASRYHGATKNCELLSSHPNGTVQWTSSPDWKVYTSQPISCGLGWYEYGSSCYMVKTTATSTWQTARDNCAALGAHLAVITDAAENSFIVNLLTSLNIGFPVFWLGGNDMAVEGTYVWETAELFVYTAYSPSSIHGIDRNCINIIPSEGWYDDDCTLFLYHVCERHFMLK